MYKRQNHAGAARFAYNWGLAKRIEEYKKTGGSSNAVEQHRQLNSLKKTEYPWMYEVSKCAPQEALRDLDRAYSNFFRRVKAKKEGKHNGKVGFPRLKSRRRGLGSFRLTGAIHIEEKRVKLPRLGWIRLKERGYLPVDGTDGVHILSATVSERAGRWFVSLQVEQEMETEPAGGEPVGVDLGVTTLATCSDGERHENPGALKRCARKLTRLQGKISRQEKGSARRDDTGKRIASLHYRISSIRSDAIHKATSTVLAKAKPPGMRPSVVVVEDLDVSGMMKNHRLAGAVADASMSEMRRQLAYKCSWYGCELMTADRFFPSSKTCSSCGAVKEELKLSDRIYCCAVCGLVLDRDQNAARNLVMLAASSAERLNARGEDVRPARESGRTPVKREPKVA